VKPAFRRAFRGIDVGKSEGNSGGGSALRKSVTTQGTCGGDRLLKAASVTLIDARTQTELPFLAPWKLKRLNVHDFPETPRISCPFCLRCTLYSRKTRETFLLITACRIQIFRRIAGEGCTQAEIDAMVCCETESCVSIFCRLRASRP
jgi:hypothetical protein